MTSVTIMKTAKTIAKTKNLISLALFQLMLRKDYESINVKEICEKAGVSRMSFYRYHNKKEDIFIDYCDQRFEEFYETYLKDKPNITIESFVMDMLTYFKKYSRQLYILRQAGKETLLLKQFNGYAKYLIAHNKSALVQEQIKNPVMGPFFAGGFFNVLMEWLDDGMEAAPEEVAFHLLQLQSYLKLR